MGNNQCGGPVQSQYGYRDTESLYSERYLDFTERRPNFSAALLQHGMSEYSNQVLNHKTPDINDLFTIGKVLGQGQFGITYLCTEISTGTDYACKTILKKKLISRDDIEDVRREIQIMHLLSGHENMVKIKDVYEDSNSVHIVMELCKGGELFDRIQVRGSVNENKAADLIRIIVGFIQNCHSLGVMHRDLKLENFMLTDADDELSIKAIDFGLSVFFKPGQYFKDIVGSPFYLAPEVLNKRYGPESDIFSAGVILYILLSGVPPFWAEDQQGIFDAILRGNIDFESKPWPLISDSAKDLITKMLCPDPDERLKPHQVLNHSWIREYATGSYKSHEPAFISRLKQFSEMNLLKRLALKVIGESLSDEETAGMREMFEGLDIDNNNAISFNELKQGLNKYGSKLTEPEIKRLMDAVDMNKSGAIECEEFIAATMPLNKLDQEHHLVTAFSYFDKKGNGFITLDDLNLVCQETPASVLEQVIKEIDLNDDGQINYSEFAVMMKNGIVDEAEPC